MAANTLIKISIFMSALYTLSYATLSNAGCTSIMDVANRPSNIDSACSVPFKKVVIELNYIDLQLINHAGVQQNYPNAIIRFGLPSSTELFVLPPNYIQQTSAPKSGSTAVTSGIKHSMSYQKKWVFALEGLVTIPGGSFAFGSQGWGGEFNGIASYSINQQLNVSAQLGISRTSEPPLLGGRSFNSINPDIVLVYQPNQKLSFYTEVYGQSKISVLKGAGFNFDAGVLVLISTNTVFNLSAGQQLYNYLGGFTHYINVGISVML